MLASFCAPAETNKPSSTAPACSPAMPRGYVKLNLTPRLTSGLPALQLIPRPKEWEAVGAGERRTAQHHLPKGHSTPPRARTALLAWAVLGSGTARALHPAALKHPTVRTAMHSASPVLLKNPFSAMVPRDVCSEGCSIIPVQCCTPVAFWPRPRVAPPVSLIALLLLLFPPHPHLQSSTSCAGAHL